MTTSEDWLNEFNLLYNNISSDQAPGLTEYEISVFLTQAQEALILDLYKGITGDSFETTEEVTRYLSSLVEKDEITITQTTGSNYEYTASLDDEVWFIVYQSSTITLGDNTRDVIVVPTRHNELFKDLNNPFRGPNKNRVLVISDSDGITLYSKYPITKYYIKYLKRPTPIVLENSELPIGDIEDFSVEIPESLHRQVLLRAVQMAKAVWQS